MPFFLGIMGRMEKGHERWFVHFRGHSLGPISTDQLKSSLRQGELGPDDKIASAKDSVWKPLGSYPELAALAEAARAPRFKIATPPPPSVLLKKKKAAPPAAPKAAPLPPAVKANSSPTATLPPAGAAANPALVAIPAAKAKPAKKKKVRRKPAKKKSTAEEIVAPQEMVEAIEKAVAPELAPLPKERPAEFPEFAPAAAPLEEPLLELFGEIQAREREQRYEPLPPPAIAPAPREEPLPRYDFEPKKEPIAPVAAVPVPERPPVSSPDALPEAGRPKELRIELRFALNKQLVFALLLLVLLAGIGVYAWDAKKTRDPEGLRPPDPSSPTALPSETGDPFPSLKAPTRPRRD